MIPGSKEPSREVMEIMSRGGLTREKKQSFPFGQLGEEDSNAVVRTRWEESNISAAQLRIGKERIRSLRRASIGKRQKQLIVGRAKNEVRPGVEQDVGLPLPLPCNSRSGKSFSRQASKVVCRQWYPGF